MPLWLGHNWFILGFTPLSYRRGVFPLPSTSEELVPPSLRRNGVCRLLCTHGLPLLESGRLSPSHLQSVPEWVKPRSCGSSLPLVVPALEWPSGLAYHSSPLLQREKHYGWNRASTFTVETENNHLILALNNCCPLLLGLSSLISSDCYQRYFWCQAVDHRSNLAAPTLTAVKQVITIAYSDIWPCELHGHSWPNHTPCH